MNFDLYLTICIAVMCIASVKGCQIVYDPATLKADAEARVLIHKEFKE